MFNQYPYLNLNDLNLDYLLNEIKSMYNDVTNFVSINAIKYANPIQWNITSQYEKNTVVIDPLTGTAYISVAAVPSGVALTRTEYWTVVFDLGSFVTRAAQNFTSRWESDTTTTATFSTSTGEWLVLGDVLYKALTNITAGDTYVVDGNIEHFTIEDLYNAYLNTIAQILALIGDLDNLATADRSSIVAAINEVHQGVLNVDNKADIVNSNISLRHELSTSITNATFNSSVGDWLLWGNTLYLVISAINTGDAYVIGTNLQRLTIEDIIGNLNNLNTTDKSSVVNAINEVRQGVLNVDNKIDLKVGDLDDLNTTDKDNLVDAINEVLATIPTTGDDIYTRLHGKKIIAFGDSFFIPDSAFELMATHYGMTLVNACDGTGSCIAGSDPQDMINRIDSVLAANDDCDYFVLIGGANDFNQDIPLGNIISSGTTTTLGALSEIIVKVFTKYGKDVKMSVMTMFHRHNAGNNIGLYEATYVEGMKQVCARYSVPCFDLYAYSGIDFTKACYSWGYANNHLNAVGQAYIEPKIAAFIANQYVGNDQISECKCRCTTLGDVTIEYDNSYMSGQTVHVHVRATAGSAINQYGNLLTLPFPILDTAEVNSNMGMLLDYNDMSVHTCYIASGGQTLCTHHAIAANTIFGIDISYNRL